MKVLQVKKYHEEIALPKQKKALERWKRKPDGYGYPVESMFYFMIEDSKGYPIKKRKNGYIAFSDNIACFGMTREKAIEKYKNYTSI